MADRYDMRSQAIIRACLFALFFICGASALSLSILSDEIAGYYENKHLLEEANEYVEKLKSLTRDYEVLVDHLENDPNYAQRLVAATTGAEPNDPNTVYPTGTVAQLEAARIALFDEQEHGEESQAELPRWLVRSNEHNKKFFLFVSGSFLIVLAFLCFGLERKKEILSSEE
jgi:hypothetical protein